MSDIAGLMQRLEALEAEVTYLRKHVGPLAICAEPMFDDGAPICHRGLGHEGNLHDDHAAYQWRTTQEQS